MITDTIAAISTPHGKGGIAVIRVSGDEACLICDKVFKARNGKKLNEIKAGSAVYGDIYGDGEIIDDGIATVFRAPHSYTGEDTVEISCHGGIILTQSVLEAVLVNGARVAQAGEFTKRAFLSGKISLTKAEAVINMIDAESKEKMRLSASQSRGVLTDKITEISSKISDVLSSVYAYIDYPDEDLTDMSAEELGEQAREIIISLKSLSESYRIGHAICEGIPTVIVGKPNTGKSSVLNRILGKERAIVTSIAGTTRDTVEETVTVGKVLLRLCDTAGIRKASDEVERIGVLRSREKLSQAELVIAVFDGTQSLSDDDCGIIREITEQNKTVIALINKGDISSGSEVMLPSSMGEPICVSAKTGDGFDMLYSRIEQLYINESISYTSEPVLIGARQYAAVKSALELMEKALSAIEGGFTQDVAGLDMEAALSVLGELDGRTVSQEITSKIFSRFCVGK